MRLIIDAMGGDNAPGEIVRGAVMGAKETGVKLTFTGKKEEIDNILKTIPDLPEDIVVVDCPTKIEMDEDPLVIIKSKRDSSMARGFELLRDGEGDAILSAGSTGALIMGSSSRLYKNKIKEIKRAAIATVLPFKNPVLLIDSGANNEVQPETLLQFATMGSIYMRGIFGIESPRVGLVNNGAEKTKGPPLYVAAHELLEKSDLNFIGNVEGRDIPMGVCDVLVCDGFTGNVILKLSEGFGIFISASLKGMFLESAKTKLAALMMKKSLGKFKSKLDHKKYGGAPILGTVKPVIKAHGSSNAEAFKNAVIQAKCYCESGISEKITMYAINNPVVSEYADE